MFFKGKALSIMGFDVNFNNKPIIKEAKQTQDGGAGNLGYFEREEDGKKKKENEKSIFAESEGSDTFNKHDGPDGDIDDFSISRFIAQIILAIKDWTKKIFGTK